MDQRKRKDHFCKKLDQIIRGQNKRLRKNNDDDNNNYNNSNGGSSSNNNNDNNGGSNNNDGGSNNNDSNKNSDNGNIVIKRWVPNKKITDQLNYIETKLDTFSDELSGIRELNNEILLTLKERLPDVDEDVDECFIADVVKQTAKLIMKVKIYPEKAEIRGAVESYLKSNHDKFYNKFSEHRWTSFYNEFIHKKLLKKIRSLRGSLAASTRDALFATFGEVSLPPINTNASPIEISEWKKKPEVENCYKKLFINSNNEEEPLILTRIVQRVFKKKYSTNEMSFVVAVCSYVLNPKYQNLKLKEKTIKRKVKIYSNKIEAGTSLLDEDENENVSESESESESEYED